MLAVIEKKKRRDQAQPLSLSSVTGNKALRRVHSHRTASLSPPLLSSRYAAVRSSFIVFASCLHRFCIVSASFLWRFFIGFAWVGFQARLFPVLKQEGHAAAADSVLWMQDVEGHASSCSSPSSSSPLSSLKEVQSSPIDGAGLASSSIEATKAWLAAERLSFKEILARADPCAEFKWRRHLEEGVGANQPLEKEVQGSGEVGGGR